MFWDDKDVLLVGFMQQGTTVNAGACCTMLEQLRAVIKQRHTLLLMKCALLLRDNVQPHSGNMTAPCSAFGEKSWDIQHTALIWHQVTTISFLF
jgi:hypothetical protein